ncbi:MAG TPA: D-alanyl-D-alanine carboxypeptidase/D-alanyl-D-alanine-endopeptidase [Polyangia bacterium]|nr:D-alanyl-D-alanine carboxypeptidase/D-alanyl-D-alanine-endopeptidase [Polyangia bacterium]
MPSLRAFFSAPPTCRRWTLRGSALAVALALATTLASAARAQATKQAPPAPAHPAAAAAGAPPPPATESEPAPEKSTGHPVMANQPPAPTAAGLSKPPPKDPTARREWLRAQLDELFGAPSLAKAKVGVLVAEADSGKPIYARSDKTLLNAASNVKIVTSAAALAMLGPEYRWKTTLSAAPTASGALLGPGGELGGDLYLRGFGDPTLNTQDLGAMVSDLASLGLRKIQGGVVVDETFFDRAHVGPAYDQKTDSYASRAPSSAASLNGNVVGVTVVAAPATGAPARVLLEPSSPYFLVSGRIVSAAEGPAAHTVDTQDDGHGHTLVVVGGRVRAGSEPHTIYRRVVDPPAYLGYTLRLLLERRGITVGKPVRVAAAPPQGLRVLSTHESAPLAVAAHELNKRSNNFAAEQVLRTLGAEIVGRPGTWDRGLEAVARFLAGAGVARGSYQMTNGSGLYESNRFSAEQITQVLRAALRDFRISAEFLASLAVAGTDGTIAHRMVGTVAERFVRAKTGTLANASCLSGIAGSPGHLPLVFSVLMNDVANAGEARRLQDRAAELLVAYLEAD